ncbi:MobV family relaxase [Nostoc sp. FACHB-145]|uniref:MobV family relaxase n=1 Tax=Nostoc sp. FACHB-145 TaxID=2692836 RepID=UPI001686A441|nr:MobV family relaxase [Nostoc sp. FACHB-145]MBD2472160.1 plasmid recombination protein [Nostoc sp. FACHB-145]
MVALAILRVEKLKSFGNIGGSEKHTARLQDTPNADPTKQNIRLIGKEDERSLESIVKELIKSKTNYQPRKDAVLCSEIFLSASPEYFRPDDPSMAGTWDNQKMEDFTNASQKWLLEKYGNKCVRAELHLDESTPHIHAYIVPLNEKTKRLSYKEMFGGSVAQGRLKMSQLQDSYALALAPLGIQRGVKGSKAKHIQVQEYYQAVNSQPLSLELERFAPLPGETAHELLERIKNDRRIQQLDHQLADRRRIIQLEKRASLSSIAREKLRQNLETRIVQLEQENLEWRQKADLMRDLPLTDVAWALGLNSIDGRWKGYGHIISIDGSKFYDFSPDQQKGGGGAIDLVMHVQGCNFTRAIAWLSESFGKTGVQKAAISHSLNLTNEIIHSQPCFKFQQPVQDKAHWSEVAQYLTTKRGIPPNLVQALYLRGLVYADAHQNAVFVMRNFNDQINGAFLRGTKGENNTFKGYHKGTKRGDSWFYFHLGGQAQSRVERAVLCKSPIEALSFATLELKAYQGMPPQRTMYLAVDNPKSLPVNFLRTVPVVEMAFDNNVWGHETALSIQKLLKDATTLIALAKGKDWNEQLVQKLYFQQQKLSSQQDVEI